MEFIFETTYHQKAMTAMARTLRKTLRRKHSRRSHVFGWIVAALAILLTLPAGEETFIFDFRTGLTYLVVLILLSALIFEDEINGHIARKRMLNGTQQTKTTFGETGYYSETEIGNTEWTYEKIGLIAETKDYFVFVFSPSHAQVYDKHSLTGGTTETFREFIQEKTKMEVLAVK